MRQIISIILLLCMFIQSHANIKEDIETITYLVQIGGPLLLFIGAPIIITLIIVGCVKTVNYGYQAANQFFKDEENDE